MNKIAEIIGRVIGIILLVGLLVLGVLLGIDNWVYLKAVGIFSFLVFVIFMHFLFFPVIIVAELKKFKEYPCVSSGLYIVFLIGNSLYFHISVFTVPILAQLVEQLR